MTKEKGSPSRDGCNDCATREDFSHDVFVSPTDVGHPACPGGDSVHVAQKLKIKNNDFNHCADCMR